MCQCTPKYTLSEARTFREVIKQRIENAEKEMGCPMTAEQRRTMSRQGWKDFSDGQARQVANHTSRIFKLECDYDKRNAEVELCRDEIEIVKTFLCIIGAFTTASFLLGIAELFFF